MELSVIIPMHNEGANALPCIRRVLRACGKITPSFELILAEDGSTDGTHEAIKSAARRSKKIRIMHSAKKLGRGRALARALRSAKGKISAYMDADLASSLERLPQLIASIRDGADVATGSRLKQGARTKRSIKREAASRGYNFLVRSVLGSRLHDHQCGFKAFSTKKILPLLGEIEDTHWFWDTELLVRAQRKGWRVDEIPVEWEEAKGTTVHFKRDALYMGGKILSLRKRLKHEKRPTQGLKYAVLKRNA